MSLGATSPQHNLDVAIAREALAQCKAKQNFLFAQGGKTPAWRNVNAVRRVLYGILRSLSLSLFSTMTTRQKEVCMVWVRPSEAERLKALHPIVTVAMSLPKRPPPQRPIEVDE